jgi:hypothetical protein
LIVSTAVPGAAVRSVRTMLSYVSGYWPSRARRETTTISAGKSERIE